MTRCRWSPRMAAVLLVNAALSVTLVAQQPDSSEKSPPAFSTGVTAGAIRFAGGRSEQGVAAIFQYQPRTWLSFSVTPGIAQTRLGDTSSSGLTDIPLSAGVSHQWGDASWSPSLSGSLTATISSSGSSTGVGLGRGTLGGYAAFGVSPTDVLNFVVGASQPLSANSGNGSIDIEGGLELTRASVTAGFSSEVGTADSGAVLARSVAVGVSFPLAGRLRLAVDGSSGLTTGAPSWTLSIGIGTAFGGHSPLNPNSALRRLKKVFGAKVASTSGFNGKGTGSCKKAGTC